jgi:hypothetical protein
MSKIINFSNAKASKNKNLIEGDPDYNLGIYTENIDFITQFKLLREIQLNNLRSKVPGVADRAAELGNLLSISERIFSSFFSSANDQVVSVLRYTDEPKKIILSMNQLSPGMVEEYKSTGVIPSPVYTVQLEYEELSAGEYVKTSAPFEVANVCYAMSQKDELDIHRSAFSVMEVVSDLAFLSAGYCELVVPGDFFNAIIPYSKQKCIDIVVKADSPMSYING